MAAKLYNPYRDMAGQWVRGSFHGHCDEHSACASVPLEQSVKWYRDVGAGFVTLTDHDFITDLAPLQARHPDVAFVQGFEYSSRENVVFAGPGISPLYELPLEQALAQAGDLFTAVMTGQKQGHEGDVNSVGKDKNDVKQHSAFVLMYESLDGSNHDDGHIQCGPVGDHWV